MRKRRKRKFVYRETPEKLSTDFWLRLIFGLLAGLSIVFIFIAGALGL